jgi:hypothetical protein
MEFGGGNPPEDPPHPAIDVTTAIVGASHAVATMIILACRIFMRAISGKTYPKG